MPDEYNSETEAVQALGNAIESDKSENTNLSAADLQPPTMLSDQAEQSTPQGEEAGTTEQPDPYPFEGINPSDLPPELQPVYKNMQAKFTQTQQQLAEERRAFGGLDPEQAREAVQFVTQLTTDPTYAAQVHSQLAQALEQSGYSPAQAQAEATRQVEAAVEEDSYSYEDENPKLQELERELSEIRAWRDEQEERAFQQSVANELTHQEQQIASHDPNLQEGDWQRIYALAYSTGGNLINAYQQYNNWRNEIVSGYVQSKTNAPAGLSPVSSSGTAQEPPEPVKDLFDPRLTARVNEVLANALKDD